MDCKCRIITEYIDDVPYEREILCKPCAAYEFGEDEPWDYLPELDTEEN